MFATMFPMFGSTALATEAEPVNLALGLDRSAYTASAESPEDGGRREAWRAFDGITSGPAVPEGGDSRWGSGYGDDHWIQVDLGQPATINRVDLYWEGGYALRYVLQVADYPGGAFRTVDNTHEHQAKPGGLGDHVNSIIFVQPVTGQIVRMQVLQGGPWGNSLWEFKVWGTMGTTGLEPCDGCGYEDCVCVVDTFLQYTPDDAEPRNLERDDSVTAVASFERTDDGAAGTAISVLDQTGAPSRWASSRDGLGGQGVNQQEWIYIDLGETRAINHVILNWEGAHATVYEMQISHDETPQPMTAAQNANIGAVSPSSPITKDWITVATIENGTAGSRTIPIEANARFIQMRGINANAAWGYSLYTFQVIGTDLYVPDFRILHVNQETGDDIVASEELELGAAEVTFATINAAAQLAEPGDTVLVAPGVYREHVMPARGGDCEDTRITYLADGEVFIKASEQIPTVFNGDEIGWIPDLAPGVWRVNVPNQFFMPPDRGGRGSPGWTNGTSHTVNDELGILDYYNPFRQRWHNIGGGITAGDVYVDYYAFNQVETLAAVNAGVRRWFAHYDRANEQTVIFANFGSINPNDPDHLVEINTRRQNFAPEITMLPYARPDGTRLSGGWGLGFITVDGFTMMHAGNWYSSFPDQPERAQMGAISVSGGYRWIIQNNRIINPASIGIDIGLGSDMWAGNGDRGVTQNKPLVGVGTWFTDQYRYGHHLVQNNFIDRAGQSGIVGVFSFRGQIINNQIMNTNYRLRQDGGGAETGAIKMHYMNEGLIKGNYIHNSHTSNGGGIWPDWGCQGVRVTQNIVINADNPFYAEAVYGPILVDNNIFIGTNMRTLDASGVVWANNFIARSPRVVYPDSLIMIDHPANAPGPVVNVDGRGRNTYWFEWYSMVPGMGRNVHSNPVFNWFEVSHPRQDFWWYNNLSAGNPFPVTNTATTGAFAPYTWTHNNVNTHSSALTDVTFTATPDLFSLDFNLNTDVLGGHVRATQETFRGQIQHPRNRDAQGGLIPIVWENAQDIQANVDHDFFGNPLPLDSDNVAIAGPFANAVHGANSMQLWPRPGTPAVPQPFPINPPDDGGVIEPPRTNIARFRVYADNSHLDPHPDPNLQLEFHAQRAFDGSSTTYWHSRPEDGADVWMQVDLQNYYDIEEIVINWHQNYARQFRILVSEDGVEWRDMFVQSDADRVLNFAGDPLQYEESITAFIGLGDDPADIEDTSKHVRFIRFLGVQTATPNGIGIREFEVYGTRAPFRQPDRWYPAGDYSGPPDTWPRINLARMSVLPGDQWNPFSRAFASFARLDGTAAHAASNAIDGNLGTRWSNDHGSATNSDWIYVDLGDIFTIDTIILRWEGAFARDFRIEVSYDAGYGDSNRVAAPATRGTATWADNVNHATDNMTWRTIHTVVNGSGGVQTLNLRNILGDTVDARSIRMVGTAAANAWGYSLWEFEVWGTRQVEREPQPRENIALRQPALASSESGTNVAANAFDGEADTRWGASQANPQWLQVDLGAIFDITDVNIDWEASFAANYYIQVSDDGEEWLTVYTQTNGRAGVIEHVLDARGRYVRIFAPVGTGPAGWGISIWNVEVFGELAPLPPLPGRFPQPILPRTAHPGPFSDDPMIGESNTIPAAYMRWVNALPAGNGRFGVMVFGDPLQEITIFNDEHMFLARPEPTWPGHPHHARRLQAHRQFNRVPMTSIEEIRQLLLQDTREGFLAANNRANETHGWQVGGEGTKHPAFYMSITHPEMGAVRDHYRYTDYRDGYIGVRWTDDRGDWERVSFVSRADRVTVQHLTAPSGSDTFDTHIDHAIHGDMGLLQIGMTYERNNCEDFLNFRVHYSPANAPGAPLYSGWPNPHTGSWDAGYEGVTRVLTDGNRTLSETGIMITDATYILLLTTTERYTGRYPGRIPGTFDLRTPDDPLYEGHYTAEDMWSQELVQAWISELIDGFDVDDEDLFELLFERHSEIHRDIMERVTMDFDPSDGQRAMSNEQLIALQRATPQSIITGLYERAFYSGRYLFLAASAEDYAPDLLGNWTGNAGAGWGGFYHMNANINLQISGGHIGNMPEAMAGFISMLEHWQEDFRFNAYMLLGIGRDRETDTRIPGRYGMLVGGNTPNKEGLISSLNWAYPYHYVTGGMGFLLYPLWEWYLITGDTDFLENTFYPLIRDMAAVYEDYLLDRVEDNMFPAGHPLAGVISDNPDHPLYPLYDTYIFVGSISSETSPQGGVGQGQSLVLNAVYDISGARFALHSLIYTAEKLGLDSDEDIARWREIYDHLPPYLVNDHGSFAEWAWPSMMNYSPYPHRHSSGLMPFWPFRTITYEENPELYHAGRQFNDRKHDRGTYERSGHGRQHASLIAANMNNTRIVRDNLIDVGMNFFWNSLATAHDYVTWTQAATSTDYCQDTSGSVPTVLMEMLATTNRGRLELLPALPRDFRTGSAQGMLGRSQFVIDELRWNLDELELYVTLTSLIDQELDLVLRKGMTGYEVVSGGATVEGFHRGAELVVLGLEADDTTTIRITFTDETRVNVALRKPGSASSQSNEQQGPDNAFDGLSNTRWGSSQANPQWLQVDLLNEYAIFEVTIDWEASFAAHYYIQVSDDGQNWRTVYTQTAGRPGLIVHEFEATARYVRMFAPIGTGPDGWGISIYNMNVYGNPPPPLPDLALGGQAQAFRYSAQSIGTENNARQPWRAFDGDNSTRWAAHIPGAPAQPNTWTWLAVDLLDSYMVERVEIMWEGSFAREFEIWVSNIPNPRTSPPAVGTGDMGATSTTRPGEGTWADDWTVVAVVNKLDAAPDTITFDPIAAQHVMMFSPRVTGSGGWPISIFNMGVFGRSAQQVGCECVPGERVDVLLPTFTEPGRWEIRCTLCDELIEFGVIYPLSETATVFTGTNPRNLDAVLEIGDTILRTPNNLGIFAQHSPLVVPAGSTLFIATTLNIHRDAELIIEGTVVVLPGGRINNQGSPNGGGTIIIAPGGTLENNGHVENVSNSRMFNNGTIINNARFEVRAGVTFLQGNVVENAPININRSAILQR